MKRTNIFDFILPPPCEKKIELIIDIIDKALLFYCRSIILGCCVCQGKNCTKMQQDIGFCTEDYGKDVSEMTPAWRNLSNDALTSRFPVAKAVFGVSQPDLSCTPQIIFGDSPNALIELKCYAWI